jgi:collagenase-like PrtC family protease
MSQHLRISLGPVLYYWPKAQLLDFYERIAQSPVDIVYLGETVCSKRRALSHEEWLSLAETLKAAGKEVVLSTLTLIEAESELKSLRRLCENGDFMVEANDMAAVEKLSQNSIPFVTGPAINIYNARTLQFLAGQSLKRWVFPIELSQQELGQMLAEKPEGVETEIFSWGRMPLAYSARCFTARAHNLPKDDCQYRCLDDPNGLLMNTREDDAFLCLNGIQTQSALTCNLMVEIPTMAEMGVDIMRVSPQSNFTENIIMAFDAIRNNTATATDFASQLKLWALTDSCNGYWHGQAGMEQANQTSHQ